MSNRTHKLIFETFSDLEKWPMPDTSVFTENGRKQTEINIEAVKLYRGDTPLAKIERLTKVSPKRMKQLLRRCQTPSERGFIIGFYGCIPHYAVSGYTRTKPVARNKYLRKKGGCSGALGALLEEHP